MVWYGVGENKEEYSREEEYPLHDAQYH